MGMRGLALFALGVAACANTYIENPVKPPEAGPLFRIQRDGKWGFMDRTGKTVIRPQFEDVNHFFEGRAAVRIGERWGFVDEAGRVAIAYQFERVGRFREGVAPVRVDRSWGFIDPEGRFLIEPRFQAAAEFHEGLARVEVWEELDCVDDPLVGTRKTYSRAELPPSYGEFVLQDDFYGPGLCEGHLTAFIDRRGQFAIQPAAIRAVDFSEGRVAFRRLDFGEWGYLDREGRVVIEPKFVPWPSDFHEGLAAVSIHRDDGNWHGVIDSSGAWIVEPKFRWVGGFSEGLASACIAIQRCGYIDRTGEFVIPPVFESGRPFVQGWARVSVPVGNEFHLTYIDRAGNTVLPSEYAYLWDFVDGLTVVGFEGTGRYYVDRRGKVVAMYDPPDPRYRSRWSWLKIFFK